MKSGIRTSRRLPHGTALVPFCWLLAWQVVIPTDGSGQAAPIESPDPFPVREVAYHMDVHVDFDEGALAADTRIVVRNHRDRPTREVPLLLYRLLSVDTVELVGGGEVAFEQQVMAAPTQPRRQVNQVVVHLPEPLEPGAEIELRVVYSGWLAGYVEAGTLYIRDRIDESFSLLRTDALAYPQVGRAGHRWEELPSFSYDVSVDVPSTHVVANGGRLVERTEAGSRTTWRYRNIVPAWRMDFAIAEYGILEEGGLRVYHFMEDSVGGARVMHAVRRSLDVFESWFGPLPEAPQLAIIEIPDGWGSQKDETAILQSAAAFRDSTRVREVYHEVSHFWNVPSDDRPSPRIEEGLASYLEDLALDVLDGGNRLDGSARRLEEWVRSAFSGDERFRTVAMADYGRHDLTGLSYGVGQLMFQALEGIAGRDELLAAWGAFFQRRSRAGATTAEMAEFLDGRLSADLRPFFQDWLFSVRWYDTIAGGGSVDDYVDAYLARGGPGHERPR